MCKLLSDLTIYGTLVDGPQPFSKVLWTAQNIVPDLWNPTSVVLADAVEHGAQSNWLRVEKGRDPVLASTVLGQARFAELMMIDPLQGCESVAAALEETQLRFLDTVPKDVREQALLRMRVRTDQRLRDVASDCRKCTSKGQRPPLWMRLEQERLQTAASVLAEAAQDSGAHALTYEI